MNKELKENIESRDTREEIIKQYRSRQEKLIALLIVFVFIVIICLQGNSGTSDIISTPLSDFLQQSDHVSRTSLAFITKVVFSIFVFVLSIILYICYIDFKIVKTPFGIPSKHSCKKLISEIFSYSAIVWIVAVFLAFNLIFYRDDIQKFIAKQKAINTEQVGLPESKIEYRGPDLTNPDDPPFPFRAHQTVEGMAKEAGLTVERLQLYSLMWTVYKNDEPIVSKFPNPRERFYELEKHHYHIVCKEKMSCINYVNNIAPINRSLITLKIAILKETSSLNVAKEYFNNSPNIDKLNSEPLVEMRDVVPVWANEIERKGMEDKAVEVPTIMYHLNIEPTNENLKLFEGYIKILDETPLNPKISIGFLKQAIDTDPNLKIPVPRSEEKLKILRHK